MSADRTVALLRGINLGRRRVKSTELRRAFEALGFGDVVTFLASGNVIFDARGGSTEELTSRIEAGLRDALGYEVPTFVRTCGEVAEAANPDRLMGSGLSNEEGVTINVVFLREAVPKDLMDVTDGYRSDDDDFIAAGRELYWLRRGRMSESPAWVPLDRALGRRGTIRNLNTVRRLLERFCGS